MRLLAIGLVAGLFSALFGVGGGVVVVPLLILVAGFPTRHAEATSLLAILPAAITGAWRQRSYGNVRWRAAAVLGVAAIAGSEAGVQIAEALPEQALRRLFGGLMILVAVQVAWRAWRQPAYPSAR